MRRQKIEDVYLDALHVPARLRSVTPERVAALASSIKEIGLQTPISVVYRDQVEHDGETVDGMYVLVAGATRLRAAESLGWEKIAAFVLEADDLEAELWEIDENLARSELGPAEMAAHVKRRSEIIVALNKRQNVKNTVGRPGFIKETAKATGLSEREVQTATSRAKNVAPDVLQSVKGTSLDKGVELDALAKKPHEEQRQIVAAVKAGQATTARIPQTRDEDDMATIADQDMARILKRYTVGQFQDWFDRISERAPLLIKQRLAA